MAEFVIQVGARSAQGLRSNNEDRYVADSDGRVFLVADGMGGQDCGEKASGMAADIIPRSARSAGRRDDASHAVQCALAEANQAIISAGLSQNSSRRMGTTAVLALRQDDQVYGERRRQPGLLGARRPCRTTDRRSYGR